MKRFKDFPPIGIRFLCAFLVLFTFSGLVRAQLPTVCEPDIWYNDEDYIEEVTFNTLSNITTYGVSPYMDFTNMSTSVVQGSTHTLTVTVFSLLGEGMVYAYFDWNGNGTLDDAGKVYVLSNFSLPGSVTYTPSITIPNTSVLGEIRMRIFVSWDGDYINGPCYDALF